MNWNTNLIRHEICKPPHCCLRWYLTLQIAVNRRQFVQMQIQENNMPSLDCVHSVPVNNDYKSDNALSAASWWETGLYGNKTCF